MVMVIDTEFLPIMWSSIQSWTPTQPEALNGEVSLHYYSNFVELPAHPSVGRLETRMAQAVLSLFPDATDRWEVDIFVGSPNGDDMKPVDHTPPKKIASSDLAAAYATDFIGCMIRHGF